MLKDSGLQYVHLPLLSKEKLLSRPVNSVLMILLGILQKLLLIPLMILVLLLKRLTTYLAKKTFFLIKPYFL